MFIQYVFIEVLSVTGAGIKGECYRINCYHTRVCRQAGGETRSEKWPATRSPVLGIQKKSTKVLQRK